MTTQTAALTLEAGHPEPVPAPQPGTGADARPQDDAEGRPQVSRLPFRSLLGPREPAGQPAALPPAHLPILALACTLEPGQAMAVIGAVLTRVLAERCPPATVILDLGTASDLDPSGGEALHGLLDRLAGCGIRFRLASASARLRAQLADAGLAARLGRGGIQPSLRAAVLAVYAAQPGPGLITPEIRAALLAPAEPVGPAGPVAGVAAAAGAGPAPAAVTPVMLTPALAGPDHAIAQRGTLAPPEPA